MMTAEHIAPQSTNPSRKNEYANCVYCCRYCNCARSATPVIGHDATLLDPTKHAWAAHFEASHDRLFPRPSDLDASYTYMAYNLDDPRKVELRRCRRKAIEYCRKFLEDGPVLEAQLIRLVAQYQSNPDDAGELLAGAALVREAISNAKQVLRAYAAVPPDADRKCRCVTAEQHSLPPYIESQITQLPLGE